MVTDRRDDFTNRIVIETTNADENIRIQNALSSSLGSVVRVTVTDPQGIQTFQKDYPWFDPSNVPNTFLVKTQGGNDRVVVDSTVFHDIQVDGGRGQDTIQGAMNGWTITDFSEQYSINSGTAHNFVLDTSDGDDTITIRQDPNDATKIQVTVNGLSRSFNLTDTITLRTGDGNDRVTIADDVRAGIKLETGAGKDYVEANNHFRNYIDTGANNDTIISTGTGNSIFYGGSGKDTITVGDGDNYVDGGTGKDTINLGNGNNVASGGDGKDTINTGSGNNVVYSGSGKDSVNASTGTNTIYAQGKDKVQVGAASQVVNVALEDNSATGKPPGAQAIKIEGDKDFRRRVQADIKTLRNSPAGQQMLEALDNSGKTITIQEIDERNGTAAPNNKVAAYLHNTAGVVQAGPTDDVTISYDPTFSPTVNNIDTDPSMILYHELAHAYNIATGTLQPNLMPTGVDSGIPNAERQAVGLPNAGLPYDFDGDPNTAPTTENPAPFTENGLRREQGRTLRPSYRFQTPPQPPQPAPQPAPPNQPYMLSDPQSGQRNGATPITPKQLYTEAYQTIVQSNLSIDDGAMMDSYIAFGLASQGYDGSTIAAAVGAGSPNLAQIHEAQGASIASQALQDRLDHAQALTNSSTREINQGIESSDLVLQ